jgi:hypothetical protein
VKIIDAKNRLTVKLEENVPVLHAARVGGTTALHFAQHDAAIVNPAQRVCQTSTERDGLRADLDATSSDATIAH